MTVIGVGDTVRSYDFPDSKDFYIEGEVERIGPHPTEPDCDRYHIRVTKEIFDGNEVTSGDRLVGQFVFPPLNGTPTWRGHVCNGVEKIS